MYLKVFLDKHHKVKVGKRREGFIWNLELAEDTATTISEGLLAVQVLNISVKYIKMSLSRLYYLGVILHFSMDVWLF